MVGCPRFGIVLVRRVLSVTVSFMMLSLMASSCAAADQVIVPTSALPTCRTVMLEQLWENPWSYNGTQICVEGYLGRMVSHGEALAELYENESAAESHHSPRYIVILVPMTPENQIELASHSVSRIIVAGVFEFDERCWPDRETAEPSRFRCDPPRPMEILNPVVALVQE